MIFAKIFMEGGGTYVQRMQDLGVIVDEIREGSVGAKWNVELVDMSEEDYESLPEFDGH